MLNSKVKEKLQNLVEFSIDINTLQRDIKTISWDNEIFVEITKNNIVNVLNLYMTHKIDEYEVELWANLIELREDIQFSSDFLQEIIFELANPILYEKINKKRVYDLLKLLDKTIILSQLVNIIQWSGLDTVEEITRIIIQILNNNSNWIKYKSLFEDLIKSANDIEIKNTIIPNELISIILDSLGMILFYRKDSNTLSSLSYEQEGSKLRLCNEWSKYIRENGFESIKNYKYEDETIIKTSEALFKYGYEILDKVYERTFVELD